MIIIPPLPRRHHKGDSPIQAPAPPAPPELIAASFDDELLELTFDVPINIVAFDGSLITVDGDTASAAELTGPASVQITIDGLMSGSNLNASAGCGIVSASGAVSWDGVNDLALPFP